MTATQTEKFTKYDLHNKAFYIIDSILKKTTFFFQFPMLESPVKTVLQLKITPKKSFMLSF